MRAECQECINVAGFSKDRKHVFCKATMEKIKLNNNEWACFTVGGIYNNETIDPEIEANYELYLEAE